MILHLLSFVLPGKGQVVNVTLEEAEGYQLLIPPEAGADTQESILRAGRLAGINGATIRFSGPVEGSSGGLGFYLGFLSLKEGTFEEGICASGVLTDEGKVLPVGGLVEKVKAGLRICRVFVFPDQDAAFFLALQKNTGKEFRMVKDVRQLPEGEPPRLEIPEIPEESFPASDEYRRWETLYRGIREETVRHASLLNLTEEVLPFLNATDQIAEKGYYYGAANYLFLLLVDLLRAERVLGIQVKPECRPVEVTLECLPLDAGASARYYWAKSVEEESPEEAYAWCLASKLMDQLCNGSIKISYPPEPAWKALALGEEGLRKEAALRALAEGENAAAVYSALYQTEGSGEGGGIWTEVFRSQAYLSGDPSLVALGKRLDQAFEFKSWMPYFLPWMCTAT